MPHNIASIFLALGFLALVIATVVDFTHRAHCRRESLDEARRMALKQRIREAHARMRGDWGTL